MPAAWREPITDDVYKPTAPAGAVPPPRPPVMRPPIAPPSRPGYYGAPIAQPTYPPPPRPQATYAPPRTAAMPVSAPRSRPVSPIAYPGLPASAPPGAAVPVWDPSVLPADGEQLSDRSGLVAGLLQVAFGWVGAGRLYTGHVAIALAQFGTVWLVGLLVMCGFAATDADIWVLGWLGMTWPVVDGILMMMGGQRDAEGRRLR
jgi:TM2 domain-containing membrane protein YozV